MKNKDDNYKRTNPSTMKTISELPKYLAPREVYKKLSKEDTFNGPKYFKQCQNVAHNERENDNKSAGKENNFADELKRSLPNFIVYTEDQIDDLNDFISHQGNSVLGVDHTFNLGNFCVTALVCKKNSVSYGLTNQMNTLYFSDQCICTGMRRLMHTTPSLHLPRLRCVVNTTSKR